MTLPTNQWQRLSRLLHHRNDGARVHSPPRTVEASNDGHVPHGKRVFAVGLRLKGPLRAGNNSRRMLIGGNWLTASRMDKWETPRARTCITS